MRPCNFWLRIAKAYSSEEAAVKEEETGATKSWNFPWCSLGDMFWGEKLEYDVGTLMNVVHEHYQRRVSVISILQHFQREFYGTSLTITSMSRREWR